MKTYSCEAILCVSSCLKICGMITFMAFKAWKREFGKFTRLQRERPKNILWKLYNYRKSLLKITIKPAVKRYALFPM